MTETRQELKNGLALILSTMDELTHMGLGTEAMLLLFLTTAAEETYNLAHNKEDAGKLIQLGIQAGWDLQNQHT